MSKAATSALGKARTAPPKLAPDAVREALEPFAKIADDLDRAHEQRVRHYTDEGRKAGPPNKDGEYVSVQVGWCRKARSALSAPVPPADGATETEQEIEDRLHKEDAQDMLRLLDYIADKICLPKDEELSRDSFHRWFRTLSPSGPKADGAQTCTCGQAGHGNAHEPDCSLSDYRPVKSERQEALASSGTDQRKAEETNERLKLSNARPVSDFATGRFPEFTVPPAITDAKEGRK